MKRIILMLSFLLASCAMTYSYQYPLGYAECMNAGNSDCVWGMDE